MNHHNKFSEQQQEFEQGIDLDFPDDWFESDESSDDDCSEQMLLNEEEILHDVERGRVFEQRKALAESNHPANNNKRNTFSSNISYLLLNETDSDISQFTDQLAYIVVSQSFAAGILKQFNVDKDKSSLINCDESMLLAALFGSNSVLKSIAGYAEKAIQELQFPKNAINCRKVLLESYERRTFAIDPKGSNHNWFSFAADLKSKICFTRQAYQLLHFWFKQDRPEKPISFDFQNLALMFQGKLNIQLDSETLDDTLAINSEKPTIFSKHRKIKQVMEYCKRKVKGQELAINAVSDMVASAFTSQNCGPLGIATFMGTPGTGKTVLAETLADSLNEIFDGSYRKIVLNMEMFSDDRSGLKLFGTGSQYVDSALGELTSDIYIAPRAVIIIDEVEKAHSSVIQSFLTLLEKGQISDQTTNKTADFSQCFIVFTTNLGHKAASKSMAQHQQLDLKSLLSNKSDKTGLSAELISRMSRGHLALFRELSPANLLSVAERAADFARSNETICWPANMAELIIETLGGNLEPRAILSQTAKLQSKILDLVCSASNETESEPKIWVDIPEDISKFSFAVLTQSPKLKKMFEANFANCVSVSTISQLEKLIGIMDLNAVLIHQPALTEDIVIPKSNTIKFFSFGIKKPTTNLDSTTKNIEKSYKLDAYTLPLLASTVQQAAKRTRLLSQTNEYRKRNVTVEFDYDLDIDGNNCHVTLRNPFYQQSFSSDDFDPPFMQEPCIPSTKFNDLIGLDNLKKQMSLILRRLRGDNDFVLDMPKGYLLSGMPGTGKSYFAKAIAGECQVPFIPVNAADLMLGNVVENINHLFDAAERYAPCIIFLDEIDAIAQSRRESSTIGCLAVNTLLTRLDGFNTSDHPVFVLAATNFPQRLDPALMRFGRFDKVISIPLPSPSARKTFAQSCASKYSFQIADDVLQNFVRKISGASFGFIENLFRDIQLRLLTEHREFEESLLDEQLLTASLGDKKEVRSSSDKNRLVVAYHETGHYLLGKHWYPNATCTTLSIQEYERAGGVTNFDYNEESNANTRANTKAQLEILLAGRAAEKLMSPHKDDITTGASHDAQQATRLAMFAISKCGFSENLGLADFEQLPMLKKNVEDEVLEWLKSAYEASEAYLSENWSLVQCIAKELFEKETLNQQELDQIVTSFKTKSLKKVF